MSDLTASNATIPARIGTKAGLVDPAWLVEHLHDPAVCVVEVDVGPKSYEEWHIPGAVLWNVYKDLKDDEYHPVDRVQLEGVVGRSGIKPDSIVVFYGYAPALGLWLIQLHGHREVRILNCSKKAWEDAGYPAATQASVKQSIRYILPAAVRDLQADQRKVLQAIGSATTTLLDVRSEAEYRGERFWPSGGMEPNGRAGHIPSAVHQLIDGLYAADGSFRSAAELREIFSAVDLHAGKELITYRTIGGRASTAWFVLTHLLGRPSVRVYDGSWAEWGRTPHAPVEIGQSSNSDKYLFVGRQR